MRNINPSKRNYGTLFAAAVACVLAACGMEQTAGIQGSGSPVAAGYTTVGEITGFGSIFVDGVEYATSNAQVRVDGQPATESQLRVGQIVTIKGSVSADGTASVAAEVSVTPELRGAVSQVDVAGNTLTVLGQTVQVTDATLFDENIQPAELAGLSVGALVEVSGFADAAGNLVASRIDLVAAGSTLQVKGTVQALDVTASTFRINSLTVNYSSVAPNGTLANDASVIVTGTVLDGSGALVATRVQVIAGLAAAANDRGKVDGIVTSFNSSLDFVVNGQRVATNSATELVLRGATLGVNVPVKVTGTFNAAGVLVASKVEVKPNALSIVRGVVEDVAAATNTLTVLGIAVTTSNTTSFNDKSSQPVRQFRLSDVRTGDYVEVRGVPNSAGNALEATLVERARSESKSYLQGTALNVFNPNFTILGVGVVTNPQTQFLGIGGPSIAPTTFFTDAPGRKVKVRGTVVGGVFIADRAQIRP